MTREQKLMAEVKAEAEALCAKILKAMGPQKQVVAMNALYLAMQVAKMREAIKRQFDADDRLMNAPFNVKKEEYEAALDEHSTNCKSALAKEAELFGMDGRRVPLQLVERFAALVAAAERERCANEIEEYTATMSMMANRETCRAHNQAVNMCATAIRALED